MAIKLRSRGKGQTDAVSHAGAVGAGLPSATLRLPAGPGRETSERKKWHLGGLKNLVRRGPDILHRGRAVLPQRNAPGRGDAPLIPAKAASLHALRGPRHDVMRAALGDFARWLASPEFESSRLESNLSDIIGAIPEALGHADTPLAVRLAFEISDGRQALAEFKEAIRATELVGQRKVPDSLLDAKFDQTFFACFDRAVASPHARVAQRDPFDGHIDAIDIRGERYAYDRRLGGGSFAHADLYRNEAGRGVVVKVPKKYERRDAALHGRPEGSTSTRPGKDGALRQALVSTPAREAGCMLNAMGTGGGEKNVTSLLATLRDEEGLMLVTPYAELGDLEHVLMLLDFGVSEPEHRSMIKLTMASDLLLGGVRLQAKNVQHRDLTALNHLVDDQGICRISDFGMAKQLGAEPDESLPDIEEHMSPPEYQPGDASTLTRAADSYQIGAMLVQLVYGLNPLDPAGLSMEQKRSLNIDTYLPPISPRDWPGVDTAALRQVMVGLMQADPARRLSLAEAAASAVFADPRVGSAETRAKLVESIRSRRQRPEDESPAEAT